MVCYMYYTDVFVGSGNIVNLKDALNAELGDSVLNDDLNELVHGLCLFMGYPSCLCSLKANVDKSLQDISRKLNEDSEAVQSSHSITTLNLNCSCNSKEILCKCCVISCIKELPGQCSSKCPRLNDPSQSCQCKDTKGKCCKDFLSGLEACLSLLNLQTDMQDCKCGPDCCDNGTCTNGSCKLCDPSKFSDNAMTGLGICPMNPRKLAEKLEKFFGSSRKGSPPCGCKCGSGPNKSCCCLACQKCSSKNSCFCGSTSKCSCASKLQLPKAGNCPCKVFCKTIQNVKVVVGSSEMRCCESGKKCHCGLGSSPCNSGQCCVVSDKSGAGSDVQQSVKCMLRRVVKFFASFDPSKPDCPKLCCEIFCVLKICVFLKMFYDKGNKKSCGKCKKGPKGVQCPGSTLTSGSSNQKCCNGNISNCSKSNCCLGCQECREIKEAKKFSRALQKLQYSGPCGLDLYRLLKDLLNFCSNVMHPNQNFIRDTVLAAVKDCSKCGKSAENSSDWSDCECSKNSGSSCSACTSLLQDSKLMSILRHGYVSSYDSDKASWTSLTSSSRSGSKCCSNSLCSQCQTCSSGSPCDPSQCCPDCPQRKAAKIFLGMLPCLYYGLKI
ncbi:hypothetical protein X943_001290, partial [Babesia divergens]